MPNIQKMFSKPCSILSLSPYSDQSELINRLQKMEALKFIISAIKFSIEAIEAFLNGELAKFDAQIGENLCQIRAYKMILLARKYLLNSHSKLEILNVLKKLRDYHLRVAQILVERETAIRNTTHYNKRLDIPENFHIFLERDGIFLELNEEIIFLITCYFLSHFADRDNAIPVAINTARIAFELNISKYRSKKLIHKYQLFICRFGCDFIQSIAKDLPGGRDYSNILPNLCQVADENRTVLPCLLVTEIILAHCLQENLPILFLVKQRNLTDKSVIYFLLKEEKNTGFCYKNCKDNIFEFCLVVSGDNNNQVELLEEYITRILRLNPLDLILANTASHPQYSGKRLELLAHNPFLNIANVEKDLQKSVLKHSLRLKGLKDFASLVGCSKNNQETFFLKHIYASTISYEINKLNFDFGLKKIDAFEFLKERNIKGIFYDKKERKTTSA